uniref:DUF3782 domain-containing protein n=1 Tax=Candidatus Kentrum eta TaxID=2126337 RepID=A0A450UE29_9GAMM|nr:MAG: hypothetical protein BECKH772A_GA0070896_1001011 [Candidatus Kentron sp. H]VFJ90692.1 MAG: hypothetical protein BECKH772B_GA0070898_1001111 [Candidatus Kentron sp. H]VFJ96855.1 MAG: hypothetical protein BECKH772C_GA0070978_1000911 [Candidatus Kentron sp. H]
MSTITFEELLSLFEAQVREFKEQARESKEQAREFREQTREAKRRSEEIDRQFKKNEQMIQELGKQIGGLGDKFGYFTQGMALPSMERILMDRFGMTTIMPRVRTRKNGEEIEIDVLAYANEDINLAIVVEVKSRVKKEAIEQLRKIMGRFRELYPEHEGKASMGILAGVDWDRGVGEAAREAGFPTAAIHDEIFELTTPEGFRARRW